MDHAPRSTSEVDSKKSQDRRAIWMFFSTIWVGFMVGALVDYWRLPMDSMYHQPMNMGHKVLATLLVLVFIGVYLYAMYRAYYGRESWFEIVSPRVGWLLRLLPMGILVVLLLLPNADSTSFGQGFVFVVIIWALTSQPNQAISSVFQATAIAALLILVTDNADGGITGSILLFLGFGVMVAGFVMNNGLVGELMVERSRVRDQAVTEERFRLARDLHDTVGHSMTQITLKAELARRVLPDDPARAVNELEDIEQLSRSLSAEVRRSIAGEVDLSLPVEIGRAKELLPSMGIEVSVKGDIDGLPQEIAEAFAWCLREGVMNTIKHSGATSCEIRFATDSDHHLLEIRDNGSNRIEENQAGQGMKGMTHRVQALNGEVQLEKIESGHVLSIRIPV